METGPSGGVVEVEMGSWREASRWDRGWEHSALGLLFSPASSMLSPCSLRSWPFTTYLETCTHHSSLNSGQPGVFSISVFRVSVLSPTFLICSPGQDPRTPFCSRWPAAPFAGTPVRGGSLGGCASVGVVTSALGLVLVASQTITRGSLLATRRREGQNRARLCWLLRNAGETGSDILCLDRKI